MSKSSKNFFLYMDEKILKERYDGKVKSLDKARERKRDLEEVGRITEPLDSLAFPGFEKLSWRACEVIKILVKAMGRGERKVKRDPWEAFIANPPNPERLSKGVKLQRAWTFYRTVLLRIGDELKEQKEKSK